MLLHLENTPRAFAWGSTELIAALEGREPSGGPEAEVWFGDHPASPARVPGGRTLDAVTAEHGIALPYLLKILAAGAPLSIQVHPSKAQAIDGYERERHLPADDPTRNYADANHKPEILVAIGERFDALAGLRRADASARLFTALGESGAPIVERLAAGVPGDVVAWLLSGAAQAEVDAIIAALSTVGGEAGAAEFDAEFEAARWIAGTHPHDPGVVVALLMNLVTLRAGEALFLRAGLLHAYLRGIGVELMASSDNVLRGGLTPKRIDVPELLRVLDDPGADPVVLRPREIAHGVASYGPGIDDFELTLITLDGTSTAIVPRGPAILLAIDDDVVVREGSLTVTVRPGHAAFIVPDVDSVSIDGAGRVFLAEPGV